MKHTFTVERQNQLQVRQWLRDVPTAEERAQYEQVCGCRFNAEDSRVEMLTAALTLRATHDPAATGMAQSATEFLHWLQEVDGDEQEAQQEQPKITREQLQAMLDTMSDDELITLLLDLIDSLKDEVDRLHRAISGALTLFHSGTVIIEKSGNRIVLPPHLSVLRQGIKRLEEAVQYDDGGGDTQ